MPSDVAAAQKTVQTADAQLFSWLKFLIGVAGIFYFYSVPYADGQKELTGAQGDGTKFKFTAFMLLVQCCGNAVFSILAHYLTVPFGVWTPQEALREAQKKFPGAVITPFFSVLLSLDAFKVSFGYIFAMYSSNRALEYVSFTLQVLAKSCKMIPVMVGSVVILGKRYGLTKVLSVVIMTGGVIWFQMMEKKRPHKGGGGDDMGSVWGPLLLAASLAADGVSGPLQEDLKKKYVLTQFQQNLVSNLWAIVLMGLVTAFHDEWTPALDYLGQHQNLYLSLAKFTAASAFGQAFIFFVIREFGSLVNTQVTTLRKLFTIVYGELFGKIKDGVKNEQWFCVVLVFVGVWIGEQDKGGEKGGEKKAAEVAG